MNGLTANLALPATTNIASAEANANVKVEEVQNLADRITIKGYVENYFSDLPVLVEVARCESHFRQFDKNGNVLRGEQNGLDRGVMQINESYHLKKSIDLGLDILTLQGNLSYARHLFEKEGLKPWSSSKPCWSKSIAYVNYQELALR